jgi:hypothetical protein
MVTLDIDNKANPFYGKKLIPGAKATQEKVSFTIKSVSATGITLDVINDESPFARKDFVEGATASLPTGATITVKGFSGDTVMIELPNTHPLAGKNLYFEVELLDIK